MSVTILPTVAANLAFLVYAIEKCKHSADSQIDSSAVAFLT
jgi:hypothetical protein